MIRTRITRNLAIAGLAAAAWCGAGYAQQTQSPSSDAQNQAQSDSQRPTPENVARDNQGGKNDAADKLARRDREFMEKVAKDNAAEIEAGKLASTQGSNEQVKQFAAEVGAKGGSKNASRDKSASDAKGKSTSQG